MNIAEWAEKLDGRRIGVEITREEEKQAKADGVLIVFGASDDLMEFRGVINDEAEAWDGGEVKITPNGTILDGMDDEDLDNWPRWNRIQVAFMPTIKAIWAPKGKDGTTYASWLIDSMVAHTSFDIFEDDELYCRGAVFNIEDLKTWGADNPREERRKGYVIECTYHQDFIDNADKADYQEFVQMPACLGIETAQEVVEFLNSDQFRDCHFRIKSEGNS